MNNPIYIDVKHQVYWLSYEYLLKYEISQGTLNNWITRETCKRKYIDRCAYINYDTIPEPSRAKLPSKEAIKQEHKRFKTLESENYFFNRLQEAYKCIRVNYWRNQILELHPGLSLEKLLEFARRASVLEETLQIYKSLFRKTDGNTALFHAFNRIFHEKGYKYMSGFCKVMDKAKTEGILSVAVDERSLRDFEPKYREDYQGLALRILSDPRAFDVVDCYEFFVEACERNKCEEIPSFGWFRLYWRENQNIIQPSRKGKSADEKANGNYAKIIPALYSGDQWQMDGYTLPFYCKKPNDKGGFELFFRYTLFVVMDTHSRKIIGFDVAESENTETILTSLDMAVRNTKTIPCELVADNHSWNKTKEAANLREVTEKLGMTWTIDSNPRRKAILERAFRTLGDKHFKLHYSYLGQGIKSKIKNGITNQELKDEYSKPENMLTYEQVCAVAGSVVLEYNNKIKKSFRESPNERFSKSEQPNSIQVDDFTRMQMFIRVSEHKVLNGQIVIKRGMYTYEYQLPAKYSVEYNGKTVGVRYSDFELIYLYDIETNQSICSVHRKSEIHGSIANQTESDTEKLFKNSGRIKGINSQKRKKKESIYDECNTINPAFIETANEITIPKDVLKQARQDNDLRGFLSGKNINTETIQDFPVIKTLYISENTKKEEKSPFYKDIKEISKIEIEIGESHELSPI